jgi:hypothetical protein
VSNKLIGHNIILKCKFKMLIAPKETKEPSLKSSVTIGWIQIKSKSAIHIPNLLPCLRIARKIQKLLNIIMVSIKKTLGLKLCPI